MNAFLTDIKQNQRRFWKLNMLMTLSIGIGAGIPFFVISYGGAFPQLVSYLDKMHIKFNALICLQPIVMLLVTTLSMCLEILGIGYERSTLKRLLTVHSDSLTTDLFYFLLRVSGIIPVIVLAISIGNFYSVKDFFAQYFAFDLLFSVHPIFHFIPIMLFHSFAFYVYHRMMHTKYFWEIHKVHHSAEDFNILLPYRNHPIDFLAANIIIPTFIAMLGAHQIAVFSYLLFNSVYQSMVHSDFEWRKGWIDEILITPEAHKIHHAVDPKYYDTNFGILTIWDKLFGTYIHPGESIKDIGVKEREDFNTGHPVTEMVDVFLRWIHVKK